MAKKQLRVDLIPAIKKLEVTIRGLVSTNVVGTYKSAFKGAGLEFEDYREYRPDDDASLIDWKASSRSDVLLVKEYIEERNLNVFFLVDVSDRMVFGSTDKLKNEYSAELAASLSFITLESGDKTGFALFSDRPIAVATPEGGMNQFYLMAKQLVNPNNYGGVFDMNEAIKFLLSFLKDRSLVIVVSDFLGMKKNWEENLKVAAKKFDLVAMMVRDPRDVSMPDENMEVMIQDPETGKSIMINPRDVKYSYEREAKQEIMKVKDKLTEMNIDYLELYTNKSFVNPIMTFFRRRHEKWR